MQGLKMITITKQCPIFLTLGLSCSRELSLINTELSIFLTHLASWPSF